MNKSTIRFFEAEVCGCGTVVYPGKDVADSGSNHRLNFREQVCEVNSLEIRAFEVESFIKSPTTELQK